jgi:hypothetical protein
MQRIVFLVFVLLLLPFAAITQIRPDFSGTWKMDPSRSESAHQDVPIGAVTLVIKEVAPDLVIETRRSELHSSAISTETLTFRLDGTESTIAGSSGTPIKTKAHWDGAKLVTETAREIGGATVTTSYVLHLDSTARELTIDKTLTVQHGYQFQGSKTTGKGTDTFIKSPSTKK